MNAKEKELFELYGFHRVLLGAGKAAAPGQKDLDKYAAVMSVISPRPSPARPSLISPNNEDNAHFDIGIVLILMGAV